MIEGGPKFERKDQRAEVVETLREKGMEDAEALALLKSWMEGLQNQEGPDQESHIETSLKVAELLHEAEQYDDAYDYFRDAYDALSQTPGMEQKALEIREKMRKLGYKD